MKKLLFGLSLLVSLQTIAQSAGILGAVNIGNFRITGTNPAGIKYSYQTGWSGGVWLRIPLGPGLSLEPELAYSEHSYSSNVKTVTEFDGKLDYWSLPVLLRCKVLPGLSITAGPEFNILNGIRDNAINFTRDNFTKLSTSVNAGIELVPRGPVTIFGRYSYGLTNMDATATSGSTLKYYNVNIQAGMKIRMLGRH